MDSWAPSVGSTHAQVIIADSVNEFSGTQGQNNWFYGFYDGPFTSSDFQLMTEFRTDTPTAFGSEVWWVDEGTYWTSLGALGGHPSGQSFSCLGRVPAGHWAVRRWVSEVAGEVTISGTLA
jgi:hypothetical protein